MEFDKLGQKYKLLTIEAIQFNGYPCIKLNNLWQALYQTFSSTQNWNVSIYLLEEIPSKPQLKWLTFSKAEFIDLIKNCSSLSMPGPDHISWCHLKILVTDNNCIINFANITNACIDLSFWPLHFKNSISIIIPKPNKLIYDSLKIFCSRVFLNIFGKIIEKVISDKIQIYSITNNFIHLNWLEYLKQFSIVDTGLYLIHLIHTGWIKRLYTSILAFNIA